MDYSLNYKKAEELCLKAEKWLNPNMWNSLFKSVEERADKAFDYYEDASNLYLLDKHYSKAGDCLLKCAKIKEELKESYLNYLDSAKNCYLKSTDTAKVNEIMNQLISGSISNGKFKEAAAYQLEKAQVFENLNQYQEAVEAYSIAIDYYSMDKDTSMRDISSAKISKADLMCISNDKDAKEEARRIYEEAGDRYLADRFGKELAKDLYAKCVLCYLLYDDYLSARAFLHKFYEKDISLKGTSTADFLEELIKIMGEADYMQFSTAIVNYKKKKMKWDKWMSVMVNKLENKIQESIKNQPNYAEEDDFK